MSREVLQRYDFFHFGLVSQDICFSHQQAPYFNARQHPHPYHSCCERAQQKYIHPCGACHVTSPPFQRGHHSQSGLACRTTSFPCANPPRKLDTPLSICRVVPTNTENLDTPNFDTEDQNLAMASQQTLCRGNQDDGLLDSTAHHDGSRDQLSTTNTSPERRWSKENRSIVFMPPILGAPTKKTTLGPGMLSAGLFVCHRNLTALFYDRQWQAN
jgi:hypothetical protein